MSISANRDRRPRASLARSLYVGAAVLPLLSACAVGPDFSRPTPPSVSGYTSGAAPAVTASAEGVAQHFDAGRSPPKDWWKLFNSPALNALMTSAFAANPGAEAAAAQLRRSQDDLRSGYGVFYPQVGGAFSATRQLSSPERAGLSFPNSLFSLFTLSASVNYALDLFGGNRRMVEALGADVDVARANEEATWLTLSGNVVNAVIANAAYEAEIHATEDVIAMEKEQVRLAEVQARAGTAPYANVLGLESELASTEAAIPSLRQKLAQGEDLLAVLCGKVPAEWRATPIAFSELTLPDDVPVSIPSALVRQRPDVLAAEATLHAATANVGVTTAALLPNITLNGGYGVNSTSTSDLFSSGSKFWSLGGTMAQPLFEGGTLWFHRKAAIDALEQSQALYRQSVLAAFEQVADALRALEHDAQALEAEHRSEDAARRALVLVQADYHAGLATYSELLIADVQIHQATIAELQGRALRYQDTVALIAALGGGWGEAEDAAKIAARDQSLPR